MEFVAILAGVVIFCLLYPLAGSYRKYEAGKELKKKLKDMGFSPTAVFYTPSAEIYTDSAYGRWFPRTDLTSSFPDIRPAAELDSFEVRESGNLILTAHAGRSFSTALFSDSETNALLPGQGKCTDFFIRINTRGSKSESIFISFLASGVQRASPEYKSALATARGLVRALAELQGSNINKTGV